MVGYGLRLPLLWGGVDSQPSAENDEKRNAGNDDFFLPVILEGAVRLSSGIHCLRLSPWLRCNWIPSLRLRMTGK